MFFFRRDREENFFGIKDICKDVCKDVCRETNWKCFNFDEWKDDYKERDLWAWKISFGNVQNLDM